MDRFLGILTPLPAYLLHGHLLNNAFNCFQNLKFDYFWKVQGTYCGKKSPFFIGQFSEIFWRFFKKKTFISDVFGLYLSNSQNLVEIMQFWEANQNGKFRPISAQCSRGLMMSPYHYFRERLNFYVTVLVQLRSADCICNCAFRFRKCKNKTWQMIIRVLMKLVNMPRNIGVLLKFKFKNSGNRLYSISQQFNPTSKIVLRV